MAFLDRFPWARLVIAAPGVAAAVVAVVGLASDGPTGGGGRARVRSPARVRAVPIDSPGPPPLVADALRAVKKPARFVTTPGGAFLTVEGSTAFLRPAPRQRGVVALTFDDGPGPMTDAFVRRLRRLRARATFFVVGYAVARRPGALRRARAAGMGIGNHSFGHPLMRALRPGQQRFQIDANEDAIQRVIGYRPLFFRPPYKSYDLVTAREIAAAGLVGVIWTVDTGDWARPGVKTIVRRALRVEPGGIVAMHDFGGDRRQTLAALGPIVRGLRKRHLRAVALDELYRPASPP